VPLEGSLPSDVGALATTRAASAVAKMIVVSARLCRVSSQQESGVAGTGLKDVRIVAKVFCPTRSVSWGMGVGALVSGPLPVQPGNAKSI
jgi:hypothetical protein